MFPRLVDLPSVSLSIHVPCFIRISRSSSLRLLAASLLCIPGSDRMPYLLYFKLTAHEFYMHIEILISIDYGMGCHTNRRSVVSLDS